MVEEGRKIKSPVTKPWKLYRERLLYPIANLLASIALAPVVYLVELCLDSGHRLPQPT